MRAYRLLCVALALLLLSGCGAAPTPTKQTAPGASSLGVLAVETFLADIAQNVAGDRLTVDALLPVGVDPHSFEPVPADITRVARCSVLIINGAGFEEFLDRILQNAGGTRLVITASAGLTPRQPQQLEAPSDHPEGDPHFWLDPTKVLAYVTNIRDGLSSADPAGAATYAANADAYIKKLTDLDAWIKDKVSSIPPKDRLLVTNHESLGYYADRYGFKVVGSIIASVSTSAAPSAQELVQLVTNIRQSGARAIFLETGTNPQMAQQMAKETGVKVVQDLYTHSTSSGAPAPTYIDMMKANTMKIVDALK